MRVLVKCWRYNSIQIACFMDDGLGLCKNFSIGQSASHFVEDSLRKSGFIVNKEKSIWQPTQKITWLGIEVDLKEKLYTITENRILSILDTLNSLFLNSHTPHLDS